MTDKQNKTQAGVVDASEQTLRVCTVHNGFFYLCVIAAHYSMKEHKLLDNSYITQTPLL